MLENHLRRYAGDLFDVTCKYRKCSLEYFIQITEFVLFGPSIKGLQDPCEFFLPKAVISPRLNLLVCGTSQCHIHGLAQLWHSES